MTEPLQYFYKKYNIDTSIINSITCGEKYVSVLLKNGNIGVCATLLAEINVGISDLKKPNFKSIEHRIVINAYYNALFNYNNQYNTEIDIFDELDFKKYGNIVMIGFFKSLVTKFKNENIPLYIFDKTESDNILTGMNKQIEHIKKADAIILTSTSVLNNSFLEIVNASQTNCDIYMLGPSTIMHKEMFNYKNIKILFGSVFNNNKVIEIINNGGGTGAFIKHMHKVFLK